MLGLSSRLSRATPPPPDTPIDKQTIRSSHRLFREERLKQSASLVREKCDQLLPSFANGADVDPSKISPRLEIVKSGTREADLFRLASLSWSIPVSEGFGRRMRFLVWDGYNEKLIGLIGLGDPVFNLHVRDAHIGWSSNDRKARLVNMMDAYALGAVPPYNMLLCGKLMACLVRTLEIRDAFNEKYHSYEGIISGTVKHAELVAVTTTSALGRSSVYNRLALDGVKYFSPLGYTSGYGHFHVPHDLFEDMREYLRLKGHSYASGNRFGQGPNWKFRSIRAALESMGIDRDILLHGIGRQVFICSLAQNALGILRGEETNSDFRGLRSLEEVGTLARERWVVPRASRDGSYRLWVREEMAKLLQP